VAAALTFETGLERAPRALTDARQHKGVFFTIKPEQFIFEAAEFDPLRTQKLAEYSQTIPLNKTSRDGSVYPVHLKGCEQFLPPLIESPIPFTQTSIHFILKNRPAPPPTKRDLSAFFPEHATFPNFSVCFLRGPADRVALQGLFACADIP
jgi:hypothetical protein